MARTTQLFAAVRHPSEPRLLLLRSDRAWRLPHVRLRGRVSEADAKLVVPAFEHRLAAPLWLLRQLHVGEDEKRETTRRVFELELLEPGWSAPANGRWVGREELRALPLQDEGQRPILAAYLDAVGQDDVLGRRAPWARPGWLADVRRWIEREAARLGCAVVRIEQVKQWSISCVLRAETDCADLYFKVPARLPYFVDEATVTARLAARFPAHVPAPVAIEPERGWLLLPEFEELFEWNAPLGVRREALQRFARLQLRATELTEELLADGCLDRRLEVLETQVDGLVADPEAVARLTVEEVSELRRLAPVLKEACRRLGAAGVPPTLVHGDLHMLNVARLGGELVYFDWTDACVAHPFVDLLSLEWEPDQSVRASLLDAYLEPWQGLCTPAQIAQAVDLAAVVVPLHHAVSYQHIVGGLEPGAKRELDFTHEFLRRVLAGARALVSAPWPGTS